MESDSLSQRKAQLDKEEREHLEDVVTGMRNRVENNVEFQLMQKGLDDEPEDIDSLDKDTQQLVEAIELEAVDGETWSEAFDQYVTGVGYTIVNRLAALRCMEVRGFIDEEVTVFKDNGLTPAAETLVHEEFLLEDEAILEAYHNACDDLAEEIEILFDRSSAYSLIDPDDDTFEELCGMLDSIDDEVWRADDVLGWVYEYYNVKLLDDLRRKGDREGLEPEDVPPANQFYTPHWVVRMLTDNSLGKLYLEHTGELQDVVDTQDSFTPEERKNRPLSPDESPDIADFCTYLVPSEEAGEPTDFDHPRELRVIDPACGSGHFLLYAFDVLERIWRAETDLPAEQIPGKILQHNIYGVDLDMRACQLAAFNLYLKGRTRAEAEGADGFDMPEVGIVCADASIAEIDGVEAVFDEVAGDDPGVKEALERILDAFEEVHGLGSLLDVRGTLGDLFEDDADIGGTQLTLGDDPRESHTLGHVLHSLREAVEEHREADSFLAQDLRSFVRLLDILAQDYDVALMNPPYGSQTRMPDSIKSYVKDHYQYTTEFYINFFEVCENLAKNQGRVGMLVPRSFMFKKSFQSFREDFVGELGTFDFLAEYGLGVLDNATVRTVGTVVRTTRASRANQDSGLFMRLHDLPTREKETGFIQTITNSVDGDLKRLYTRQNEEFQLIPGAPLTYWVPRNIRELFDSDTLYDADNAGVDRDSLGTAKRGMTTGNNDRFYRYFWEVPDQYQDWAPVSKGGEDAWILPRIKRTVMWEDDGTELKRYSGSYVRNEDYYFRESLTWTYIKEAGRRFGLLHENSIFSGEGQSFIPDADSWNVLSFSNSHFFTYLMLAQTTGRHWNVGEIAKVPWDTGLESIPELEQLAKDLLGYKLALRRTDIESPYYIGPRLLAAQGLHQPLFHESHPHRKLLSDVNVPTMDIETDLDTSIDNLADAIYDFEEKVFDGMTESEREINTHVFDYFNIDQSQRGDVLREVEIRTGEEVTRPSRESEAPETVDLVEELLFHFVLKSVQETDDGVIPIRSSQMKDIQDHVIEQFRDVWGEFANERLAEADDVLGSKTAENQPYPNLQNWLAEELFEYQLSYLENTPVVWRLTSERLVSDPKGEGFGCVVDYNRIDSSLFDRLENTYLDPRKSELRERRNGAQRRREDDSISARERSEANESYEACVSGLQQIERFQEQLQELAKEAPREESGDQQVIASSLQDKVRKFREDTERRLTILDQLRETKDDAWFEDTFSPTFWDTVADNRDEWTDALQEIEQACAAYDQPEGEPIEPRFYDLLTYFSDLVGSDHYSSNGILFMTYYFEREGDPYLTSNGEPRGDLQGEAAHLASLGKGVESYKDLANKIEDDIQELQKSISSSWTERALSEITTNGYTPNHKHGVRVNILPFSDAEIVPEAVDEKVL